ncbi:MAG TPA: SRPBCC family protein [Ilumatobacter sp.]|nr:SRPBCC family protein [Ilumatobacter sp.]
MNRPIEEAWPIICDLEQIAPCMPGAQLDEIEGEIHRGTVKVKLGAITAQFKGEAVIVERDDEAHTATMKAKGRDTGGRGNAEATISAAAEALSPTSTRATVTTDLMITGKVAQFGRGIMGDVSKKLMDQFADNLNAMLDEQATAPPTEAAAEAKADDAAEPAPTAPADDATPAPAVRKIDGPAAEPIDMAELAGPALIKRLGPVVAALLVLLLILRKRK